MKKQPEAGLPDNTSIWGDGSENIIKNLEQYLEQYDVLLLFDDTVPETRERLAAFLKSQALENTEKNVLVLAVEGAADGSCGQHHCRMVRLTREDYKTVHSLYHMYEFSDRVRVMEQSGQYGSLENYVHTGLMTMEEMFGALLH